MFDEKSKMWITIYKNLVLIISVLYLLLGIIMCFVGWSGNLQWFDGGFFDGVLCLISGAFCACVNLVANMLIIQLLNNVQIIRECLEGKPVPVSQGTANHINVVPQAQQSQRQAYTEPKQTEPAMPQTPVAPPSPIILNTNGSSQMEVFLVQASGCTRITEINSLWNSFTWDDPATAVIGQRISQSAQVERMYGHNPIRVAKLLDEIRNML